MIEVTRLNGIPMMLNSDLIKIAESSPDTMLTLIHGEKLIVRESCAEIVEKVLAYRAQLLASVAARMSTSSELHRVVAMTAMTSLHPDAPADPAGMGSIDLARTDLARSEQARALPLLQLEPRAR